MTTNASAETRAGLLDATVACLAEHGLHGTTSRRITARAGANLAAITYHFGSKDRLISEALLAAVHVWLDPIIEGLDAPGDPAARALATADALRAGLTRARPLLPVYFEALLSTTRLVELRGSILDLIGQVRSLLAAQIAQLQRAGVVPAWADPAAMATLQIALADGLAFHAVLEPEAIDGEAVAAQFMGLLLAAGANGAGRAGPGSAGAQPPGRAPRA